MSKTPGSQMRNMQDCMTEDVIRFIYAYFVDNSDTVKANSALQEDTKSQISDDLLAFILLAFFKII